MASYSKTCVFIRPHENEKPAFSIISTIHYFHTNPQTPCLPPPPPPRLPKVCISIVFKFFWEDCKIFQEKLETRLMQNFFWGGGGGGYSRCIMGKWKERMDGVFFNRCVVVDCFHRIRVDGRPNRRKKKPVFKQKRIRVDRTLIVVEKQYI